MKSIDKRIRDLEQARRETARACTREQAEDKMCERHGMTRAEVLDRYGGFPALAYAAMIDRDHRGRPFRNAVATPAADQDPERNYMNMIGRA